MRLAIGLAALLIACGGSDPPHEEGPADGGAGGHGGSGAGGGAGEGGSGGVATSSLEDILAALRMDRDAALLAQSNAGGWPAPVEEGFLVVSTDPSLTRLAGDHDAWVGAAMNADDGFAWLVVEMAPGGNYKLTDGTTFVADPWSRAYRYDEFGEMSQRAPATAHLERYFQVASAALDPRTVRVWVPEGAATHLLIAHDGQNLFGPEGPFGGWHLDEAAPAGMMIAGIDNTPARMDEYTHVVDQIGGGPVGGAGDDYADFVVDVVRPLLAAHYPQAEGAEPPKVGLLGSSLGGLISLHVADRYPDAFVFAASLSGTVGWGSIGLHNETVIERYAAAAHRDFRIYVDSGGDGVCFDGDADGIEDDGPSGSDNFCENQQLHGVLLAAGYSDDVDLFYWHEAGAQHNEVAWAARVWRPLAAFAEQ
jgi:hypothetical protein